jgi:hypothetical protein
MQSNLDGDKCHLTEALQVPTATSGCATQESEGMQQEAMFTYVKVKVSFHSQKLCLKMEVFFPLKLNSITLFCSLKLNSFTPHCFTYVC